VCGPDITDALVDAVSRTKTAFASWSTAKRKTACDGLIGFAPYAWDITKLRPDGREAFVAPYRPKCGTCGSGRDIGIGVNNECHFAGSVNYVIYGAMMRVCHDFAKESLFASAATFFTKERMELYIQVHKTDVEVSKKGVNLKEAGNLGPATAWARAGYDGWPGRPTPRGDRSKCGRCAASYHGKLTVQWFPYVIT
jgi:hypothetical protein